MMSSQMYQEIILDHFRNPRNKGACENCNAFARDVNTSCGDEITFTLYVGDGLVKDAKFEGKGCAISQAAASMLTEKFIGMRANDALKFDRQQVLDLLGVPISGMRLKCALLCLKVAKMALVEYASSVQ